MKTKAALYMAIGVTKHKNDLFTPGYAVDCHTGRLIENCCTCVGNVVFELWTADALPCEKYFFHEYDHFTEFKVFPFRAFFFIHNPNEMYGAEFIRIHGFTDLSHKHPVFRSSVLENISLVDSVGFERDTRKVLYTYMLMNGYDL